MAVGALGAEDGAPGAGALGLWLYCNDAGDAVPVPLFVATAPLPRNVDIGGNDGALVTAEPRIGAGGSPFGDIAEYAYKTEKKVIIKLTSNNRSIVDIQVALIK